MRIRLDIAYAGTRYVGWQRQSAGSGVQAVVERALGEVYAQPVLIVGAGRTDAGVHAAGQVAHFDAPRPTPGAGDLAHILNRLLPDDVAIFRARQVSSAFHARRSAVWRTYRYRILTRPVPDPFRAPYVWHAPWASKLNIAAMRRAAGKWIGTKDFAVFAIRVGKDERTTRRMERIDIRAIRDELRFHFVADSFLHRMIRRMVAVLVQTGSGKSVFKPAFAAPARGLCLVSVAYK